jgi:hypothetical protein
MRRRHRQLARLVAGIAAAFTAMASAPATATAMGFAVADRCDHHQAYVAGDESAVAGRLPDRYTPVRDRGSGGPVLFVRAIRCPAVTIGDATVPVTMASFGVVVESPDGRGCLSGAPVAGTVIGAQPPACNWYALAWQADHRRVADWLRDGTPGFPALHATGLAYTLGAFEPGAGGTPFSFEAPPSSPAPFRMEGVGRERPGQLPIRGGYWHDTPQGIVKLAFSTEDMTSGDADGTVSAPPGSELARLMGATERPFLAPYSFFAAERWERAVYRKQIVTPGPRSESFAGSCSLQGDVTFSPPASNTPGPLEYAYTASGTCSGRLGGRQVADVPVTLTQQRGHSYGSCTRAQTTSPGRGALAFAGGETIRYTLDFTTVATEVDMTWYGERSGTAAAHGTFRTARTSGDVAARCRTTGVSRIPMDTTLTTQTPLVSDRTAGGGQAGPDSSRSRRAPRARRLRVAVVPRTAKSGRRTRFVIRARSASGRPLAGVAVRFAGRRARTGRAGTARITATVRRRGLRPVRATRRGFRPGRVSVRVR